MASFKASPPQIYDLSCVIYVYRSMIYTCNSMKLHEVPQHIPTATQKWGYIRCPAKVGGSKILIGWDNKWVILALSKMLQLDVFVLLPGCIPGYHWKNPSNISVAGASTHFALLHSLGTRQIAEGDLAIDHLAPSNSRDGFLGAAKKPCLHCRPRMSSLKTICRSRGLEIWRSQHLFVGQVSRSVCQCNAFDH